MHVMLDLETLGTRVSAPIISIGAVGFDGNGILTSFSANIDLGAALDYGKAEGGAVEFWLRQGDEARLALVDAPRQSMVSALGGFHLWLHNDVIDIEGIWGNGAAFDNVLLRCAYETYGMPLPWSYKLDRCFRTMRAMYPWVEAPEAPTVAHRALDDARAQALHLQAIWREVGA